MRRAVAAAGSVVALAVVVAATGVQGSLAAWTDAEWDAATAATLDCAVPGAGSSTATGRLLGGTLLGSDLDAVAEVHGVTVTNDGVTAVPDPSTADPVVGSAGQAFQDALTVGALQSLELETGNLLVLPLETDTGVYGQYARADRMAGSAGAAGLVTDSGGIDLGPFTAPEDERPEFGTLRLGALLEEALGAPLATAVATGITDLSLEVGAVAGAAVLDGCAADWGGDVYGALERDYAIAGLGLGVDSPLVGGLVTAADGALDGVETAVNGLSGDAGLLAGILSGVTGALSGVLGAIGVSGPTATLTVTVDLSAARQLLTAEIGDEAGILAIDLDAGTVGIDLAALFGETYGSAGLNGLEPNTELLVDAEVLAVLEDALTDAIGAWAADLVAAVQTALDAAFVDVGIDLPLRVTLLGIPVTLGVLNLDIEASLADLLDGDAVVQVQMDRAAGLCSLVLVGTLACSTVTALLNGLTPALLDTVALTVGSLVDGALDTIGAGLTATLDTALDAPAAALLGVLDGTLSGLLGPDGVLSVLVNAQNDPDPAEGAGPPPPSWSGIRGATGGDPLETGRYDVAALLVTVLGAVDAVELAFARGSAGSNVVF